jgi:hypothetical protein
MFESAVPSSDGTGVLKGSIYPEKVECLAPTSNPIVSLADGRQTHIISADLHLQHGVENEGNTRITYAIYGEHKGSANFHTLGSTSVNSPAVSVGDVGQCKYEGPSADILCDPNLRGS